MNPEDPEQYIRGLERGVSETPGAAPAPFGTVSGSPIGTPFSPPPPPPFGTPLSGPFGGPGGGPYSGGPYSGGFGAPRSLRPRRARWRWVVAIVPVGAFLIFGVLHTIFGVLHTGNPFGQTTVHGYLDAMDNGGKQTIACNNGDLKVDGDGNTFTVTGHCRRLDVFGSANHVTVDSADTISAIGDDNAMIYHSGAPTINKTGNNNTVSQG